MEEKSVNEVTQMKETENKTTQMNNYDNNDEKDSYSRIEVAPALIAIHPFDQSIVVTVGSELRIFDLLKDSAVSLEDDSKESVRAVRFSESGKLLVSAGDDKKVKIWSSGTWQCLCTINSEKRMSAVAISKNEEYVCFADKFGVVWSVDITDLSENQPSLNKKAVAIFGHYCSIITSLEFSPDGQFIVSADRDFKIRVSVFPKKPLNGVHEIQSFCLGHSEFVTCLTFVHNPEFPTGYLVSGSGDSTVCLWDITSGSLLCTSEVGREAGLSEESQPAVTDLCATPDGSLVAVALQSLQGILMISCDLSAKTLSILKLVSIPGETFIPTNLKMMTSGDTLWMVTGASNLPGSNTASFTRIKVMSSIKKGSSNDPTVLEDTEIPGGDKLLEKLQGSVTLESKIFDTVADALNVAMSNLLRKKHYSEDKREFRKKSRNDKKFKH